MIVSGLRCGGCKDVIYSCARHDFRTCTCKGWFVDGGFDYIRVGGLKNPTPPMVDVKVEVDALPIELMVDYNSEGFAYRHGKTYRRKFGLLRRGRATKYQRVVRA